MNRLATIAAAVMATVLAACTDRPLVHSYKPVDTDAWACTDTVRFHLPPAPRSGLYTMSLGVRTTDNVDFRDLWLVMEQRTTTARRDTLHLYLASERAHWQTKGMVLHEMEEVLCAARLEQGQEADILVYHIMQRQEIRGITEVGIKVQ